MNPNDPNQVPPKDNFGAKPEEAPELQNVENNLEDKATQDVTPPAPAPTTGSEPVIIPADDSADTNNTPAAPVTSFGSNATPPTAPKQKKSKKLLIIILSLVLVAALAVGGYAYWQSTQGTSQPAPVEDTSAEAEIEAAPVETTDGLDAEIETIESEIEQIDDSEFQDDTLSDETLEQQ